LLVPEPKARRVNLAWMALLDNQVCLGQQDSQEAKETLVYLD
jgi:hypothetical protein